MWKFLVAQGQVTQKQFVWSGPKSNSSKIVCLSSLPARLKTIQSKDKVLSCPQRFLPNKSIGKFFDAHGWVTPKQIVRTDWKSNSFQDFMHVLVTCKFDEDPTKNKGANVFATFFSGTQGQATPKWLVGYGQNSNLSDILCLITYKFNEDLIKNEGAIMFTTFSPL